MCVPLPELFYYYTKSEIGEEIFDVPIFVTDFQSYSVIINLLSKSLSFWYHTVSTKLIFKYHPLTSWFSDHKFVYSQLDQ